MTEYLQFIRGLDNHTFCSQVAKDNIPLLPPYDSLVADVLSLDNPTPEQINKVAKLYLHRDDYDKLIELESDLDLAMVSYKKLVNNSVRDEVVKKLEYSAGDMDETLDKVESILSSRHINIPKQRAKAWVELDERTDDVMFQFMKYNISRGKLSLVGAFSGIGKTTLSLCFANVASCSDMNVLLIAIRDWSEAELKRKTSNLAAKERVAFSVFGDCALTDIDYEIRTVQPDVVIVDALTDITMKYTDKYHKTIGDTADRLREMAVNYDCHMFTTHQAKTLEPLVIPEHLRDSKSDLLEAVDIGWGLGCGSVSDTMKVVSTIKIRHQESVRPWKCAFDYHTLEIHDKGWYNEKGSMFRR